MENTPELTAGCARLWLHWIVRFPFGWLVAWDKETTGWGLAPAPVPSHAHLKTLQNIYYIVGYI
jgi:hypothetical protein